MIGTVLLLFLATDASAFTETVTRSFKMGRTKFTCSFTMATDGISKVDMDVSKAVCTPNKPTGKSKRFLTVVGEKAIYNVSLSINPEKITFAEFSKTIYYL